MARDFSSQSPFLLASFFVIPQDADSRSASASPYPIFLTNNGTAESPKQRYAILHFVRCACGETQSRRSLLSKK